MARLVSRSGRSRLPALLIVVLLASSVLALAAFYLFPRPASLRPPAAAPAGSTPAPSGSRNDEDTDTAPTGCLGGQQRDSNMVLAAQRQAPRSTYGAVEVAAAVFRWGLRYPYPSPAEVRAIRPVLAPATATKQEADLSREYQGSYQPPIPGEQVADGTPYYVTTANGSWLIGDNSTDERIKVQVETHPVVDDAYSTSTVILEFDLQWTNGSWHLRGLSRADAQALANGGTMFTSGC